jgi:1-aminocyclopropane-1-carboxylate deaminase
MPELNLSCRIDSLNSFYDFRATVDVLRLDLVHPVISGNKWFKLKAYVEEAKVRNKVLVTFGGAFSNHIVATAAAAKKEGLRSIGIIRGERAPVLSHTLMQAKEYGMELHFTSRKDYKNKIVPEAIRHLYPTDDLYMIPEGGYGEKGVEGAKDILLKNSTSDYTHIISAAGTGTTLAGLIAAAMPHQTLLGISVFKNNQSLEKEIRHLLPFEKQQQFELLHDYHFGGYAKQHKELIRFMNAVYERSGIPTDFVYTAKAFYAAFDLLKNQFFSSDDNVLLIHTGGLQGNLSLPKGTLIFG